MSEPVILRPGFADCYSGTQFERKAHGAILMDGQEVAHTLQCPHCGGHFISRRGSGHRRTFCMRCQAVTCGCSGCDACMPFEQRMALLERG